MKPMDGIFTVLAAGLFTALGLQRRQAVRDRPPIDYLHFFLNVLVASAALFLVSLLLPEATADLIQDFMAWCLTGTVAAIALMATVKGLESLLDS